MTVLAPHRSTAEPTLPSPLLTAQQVTARYGSSFTPQPSGTEFKALRSYPGGATRAETRSFQSILRVPGAASVSSGALLYDGEAGDYLLITAATSMRYGSIVQHSELTALKCNAAITLKRLSAGSWSTVASSVRCAILNQPMTDPSDKSQIVPTYRGTTPVAWGHFQTSVGIQQGDQVVDGSRVYLVSHDLNPTLMAGIMIARLDLRT